MKSDFGLAHRNNFRSEEFVGNGKTRGLDATAGGGRRVARKSPLGPSRFDASNRPASLDVNWDLR